MRSLVIWSLLITYSGQARRVQPAAHQPNLASERQQQSEEQVKNPPSALAKLLAGRSQDEAFQVPGLGRKSPSRSYAKPTDVRIGDGRAVQMNELPPTPYKAKSVGTLSMIGSSIAEKALQVNLDESIYGSFAEIGAGQEVSRTFLRAGAAAGTVAMSVSAYDMQMSDAQYGSAKRYVTEERVIQMMKGEYDKLERYVREGKAAWGGKGKDVRFFSFASTLAAKAYMSDRECEGWVGVRYQHEPGAKPSTVTIHVRMSDPTAQLQGQAIGVLGTNLIYLISKTNDPYLIGTFLQDGLEDSRLEVDFIDAQGPGFPPGSFDPRLLALRLVQWKQAPSILLEPDPKSGEYKMVVPNDALYKTPVVVQRSRFLPTTCSHQEVMEAAERQVLDCLSPADGKPKCIFSMQVDDISIAGDTCSPLARIQRSQKLIEADANDDGYLSTEELKSLIVPKVSPEEASEIVGALDPSGVGYVEIDTLSAFSERSLTANAFQDRIDMLGTLDLPILVSAKRRDDELARYLARYTTKQVTVVLGGGNYSIEQGIYDPEKYAALDGGLLEAFGRLFAQNVQLYQFPNIADDGTISPPADPGGANEFLHQYFLKEGKLVKMTDEYLSELAKDPAKNKALCGGSFEVRSSLEAGTDEWRSFVSDEVAKILEKGTWNLGEKITRYLKNLN